MLLKHRSGTVLRSMLAAALAAITVAVPADHSAQHKVVDGVEIYVGIVPAEMVQGHPKEHPESEMHGGIPAGKYRYHVAVALFDQASGKRITGAEVKAKVGEPGYTGPQKRLESMLINSTVSYGNYFILGPASYRIEMQIRRPGVPGVILVDFESPQVRG